MTVMSEGMLLNSKYIKMGREEGVFKLSSSFFFYYYFIIFFFHENNFYFFLFRDVPGCSGMFRNVPACSGMFRVPGFIDALKVKDKTKASALGNRGSLWEGHLDMNNLCNTIKILGDYFGGESRC